MNAPASRNPGVAGVPVGKSLNTRALRVDETVRCARPEGAAESRDVRLTDAQRRTNAAWLRAQIAALASYIEGSVRAGKTHRWPPDRVAAALRDIEAGRGVEVER